jgi:hypothetical protein
VNRWSIGVGASLLGTAKQMRSFPFTYGQNPGPDRVLIAEKGAAAEYWAKKPCSIARAAASTIAVEHFACAYRNGLGQVILMQTTEKNCGPGNNTHVTQQKRDDIPEPTIHAALALFKTNNIIQLTASQRTSEWFNQRRFCITGTGALAVWRHFASSSRLGSGGELLSLSVKATCNVLGLKYLAEPAATDCTDDRDWVLHQRQVVCFSDCAIKDYMLSEAAGRVRQQVMPHRKNSFLDWIDPARS